jgi:hypothetical protein
MERVPLSKPEYFKEFLMSEKSTCDIRDCKRTDRELIIGESTSGYKEAMVYTFNKVSNF